VAQPTPSEAVQAQADFITSRIAVALTKNLFRTHEADRSLFIMAEQVVFTRQAARLAIEQANGS